MPFQEGNEHGKDTRFKPGESGNPAGYPPGQPNRSTVLKRLLALQHTIDNPLAEGEKLQVTVEEAITWGLIQKAASGDTQAFKEIMDSVYGKVPTDITSGGEKLPPATQVYVLPDGTRVEF